MASAGGHGNQEPPDNVEVVPMRIPAPGELPGYTPPGEAPWGGGRSPEYSPEDPMLVANSEEARPTSALGQLVHYIKRYSTLTNLFTGKSTHRSQFCHSVFSKLIPKWFLFMTLLYQLLWTMFIVQRNCVFPV